MPFYPFFWHISETVRAISPHMSRKVERNEDFEKNTLVWRDLTTFITAFCDFVSSTIEVLRRDVTECHDRVTTVNFRYHPFFHPHLEGKRIVGSTLISETQSPWSLRIQYINSRYEVVISSKVSFKTLTYSVRTRLTSGL